MKVYSGVVLIKKNREIKMKNHEKKQYFEENREKIRNQRKKCYEESRDVIIKNQSNHEKKRINSEIKYRLK